MHVVVGWSWREEWRVANQATLEALIRKVLGLATSQRFRLPEALGKCRGGGRAAYIYMKEAE